MYGAKFISLYTYFAQRDTNSCDSGWTCHAIIDFVGNINNEIYTDKYYMLRDTLNPRLKGLFGKTLKGLVPVADSLGKNASASYTLNFDHLSKVKLDVGESAVQSYVDIGSFNKPGETDENYFMVINRWYSGLSFNKFKLELNYLSSYNNWNLKNYVDSTEVTIVPDQNGEATSPTDTIVIGDAILYSLKPVVEYSGTLISDETVGGVTLIGDMVIDSLATLSIDGNYYAQGDIIIKNGTIENYDDGIIHFQNGHKLIVDGTATINGTSGENLTLDFTEDSSGVVIKSGGSLTISYCNVQNADVGIESELNANYLNAQYLEFDDCDTTSILINGRSIGGEVPPTQIKYCTMTGSEYGIWASNLPELVIQENTITNTDMGIYLSNVSGTTVALNTISSNKESNTGIFTSSMSGVIRGNTISGHTNGIQLGNSSPDIGGNIITSNRYHGIYIGAGSNPFMQGDLVGSPPVYYAVSGYNTIKENGGYSETNGPPDNDGSEIYFYYSNATLRDGCNEISDDRPESSPLDNTELLLSGSGGFLPIQVNAENNFWGDTVYSGRFGSGLNVDFNPYYISNCPMPDSSGEGGGRSMLVMTSNGGVIDTLYSAATEVPQLTSTEILYADAEENFITTDYTNASSKYNQIINSQEALENKYPAYKRLYEIGSITGEDENYFNGLRTTFLTLSSSTSDSLLQKVFSQLASLSLIKKTEIVPAIGEFDNIVQQNPNTEEAVYAEIDAITAASLLDRNDSTLQKGSAGGYLVKTRGGNFNKIDNLLKKNFGRNRTEAEKEIIPTEYTLYQNYPNPFNPVTTIKYDLPNIGEVSVIIYDILGRKIKELINTKQQAGRYEVKWDASGVASGVYLYQLRTKDYVNTKKMILLR